MLEDEEPIAACETIMVAYKKTAKGIAVTFLIQPLDAHEKLALLPLGEIVKIYITKPQIGI